jgi:hypothetical protein
MPPSDSLVFVAVFPVIKCKNIIYYKDKVFSERSKFSTDVLDSRNQLLLDRLRNEKGDFVSKEILNLVDAGKINLWDDFVEIQRKIDDKEAIFFKKAVADVPLNDFADPVAVVATIPLTKPTGEETEKSTWQALAKRRQNLKSRHEEGESNNSNNNTDALAARREAAKKKVKEMAAIMPEADVDEQGNEYETPVDIFEQNSISNEVNELDDLLGLNGDTIDDVFFSVDLKPSPVEQTYELINKLKPRTVADSSQSSGFDDFEESDVSHVTSQGKLDQLSDHYDDEDFKIKEGSNQEEVYFDPDEGELESNITNFGFTDTQDSVESIKLGDETEDHDNAFNFSLPLDDDQKEFNPSEETDNTTNTQTDANTDSKNEGGTSGGGVSNSKSIIQEQNSAELPAFKIHTQPLRKEEPIYFQDPLADQENDEYNPDDYIAIARGDYTIPDIPTMDSAPSVGFGATRSSIASTEHMKMKRYYSNNANLVKKLI